MSMDTGSEVFIPATIREIADGKARCEWVEGGEQKTGWFDLSELKGKLPRREMPQSRGGSFWST